MYALQIDCSHISPFYHFCPLYSLPTNYFLMFMLICFVTHKDYPEHSCGGGFGTIRWNLVESASGQQLRIVNIPSVQSTNSQQFSDR